jgi:hypothetical protein
MGSQENALVCLESCWGPVDARLDIDVAYFAPTRDGWEGGDREITCYLTPTDGQKITHSYKVGAAPAAS